ncbi:hypothetical protein DFH09DRAFT_940166 [Mycena vulgaris]|nr:hypothetical protein DFH09DRAFT_940166 [Mycena vulgaris]
MERGNPPLEHRLRDNSNVTLKLRGLIYHSEIAAHFTSVVLDAEGLMWYHDGITTKRTCVNNGRYSVLRDLLTIHWRHEERLCAAIYALK